MINDKQNDLILFRKQIEETNRKYKLILGEINNNEERRRLEIIINAIEAILYN